MLLKVSSDAANTEGIIQSRHKRKARMRFLRQST